MRIRYLSSREAAVAYLIVTEGLSNQRIAARLGLTEGTVKGYIQRALRTLGFRSRHQMLADWNRVMYPEQVGILRGITARFETARA